MISALSGGGAVRDRSGWAFFPTFRQARLYLACFLKLILVPVLTLLALYTGYRLLGVGGMIVFPIAAMLFKQLWDHSGLQPDG